MTLAAATLEYSSDAMDRGPARPMRAEKRKIKAKPLVNDLRLGLTDNQIMAKYGLNESQYFKVLRRLEEAGLIGEMEMFERSSLSESTVMQAMTPVEIYAPSSAAEEEAEQALAVPDSETMVECTEVINMTGSFRNLINSLREGAVKVAKKELF